MDSTMLATPPHLYLDGSSMPELLINFEDEYSSLPSTPLDFSAMDVAPWNYTQSTLCASPVLLSPSGCDTYLDAAALFDAYVYR